MDALHIAATRTTPEITFDAGRKVFLIRGRSIPADANSFFLPLRSWIEKFADQLQDPTINIDINLEHLNTGSVRALLTILAKLLRLKAAGKNIQINWHHEFNDEDLVDKGEEMSLILEHPFKYIPFKEEH
jgi:hypothetical protein